MENRRNYYRVLHVQRDAPVEIIKTSYRTMMQRLKMHPDLGGDHWQATVVNEAYATLIDPDKRAAYDRTLTSPEQESNAQTARATEPEAGNTPAPAANVAEGHCTFCAAPHQQRTLERDSTCGRCDSPLMPAEHDRHDDDTRRAVTRMPKSFPIRYVAGWPAKALQHGTALDLSINGLRFMCDKFVPTGTLISIESEVCSAVAEVRSSLPAGPGIAAEFEVGVRFVTLRFHRSQGGFVSVTA